LDDVSGVTYAWDCGNSARGFVPILLFRCGLPHTGCPMPTRASTEGTRRYTARFSASAAPNHFRALTNCAVPDESAPMLSSIGIGTYLGQPDEPTDQGYTAAIAAAVQGGINVIDSAINYRFQRSERSIAAALRDLQGQGISRDEVFLSTKGGYLTPDAAEPGDPQAYFEKEYLRPGMLRAEDVVAGCHSMSPSFLANQLDRSMRNLAVDCVDLYYVHNPETQLGEVPRDEFLRRLRDAFTFLESAVADGKICFYGLATWNGFRQPIEAPDYLSLAEIEQTAREVAGGRHHFRFVQLPFNLAMTEALTRPNQSIQGPPVSMIEAAEVLGITLMASATLLQSKVTRGLPAFIADALGLQSDAERAIQFVRSSPQFITALVGMSRIEHVHENLRLVGQPIATAEQYARLFARGQKA
jgi:aryl-alcohol dehydrogenase-like predicted oxidoreductase